MDKETGFVDNDETGLKWYEDKKYDFLEELQLCV